jgi:predicted transposase/invertase (TIGR01784 family)
MGSEQNTDSVHQQHDTSYKFLLSSKKIFVELLRSFVDRGWVHAVDEEQLEQIPHSFILQDFKRKEADLVYRLSLNGQEVVFYILMELQSRVDYRMPYRLLLYQVEIWRYLLENKLKGLDNRKSFQLPPIVPIVLYNGGAEWTASRQFRQLLANEQMFSSELLNFEYILIDVERYNEEDLLAVANTIGAVFFLDQTEDRQELTERLHKLMHTIQKMPEENRRKFTTWMSNIVLHKVPEQAPVVQQWLESMKGDAAIMGLEKVLDDIELKGIQKGREEEKEKMIRKMISLGADNAFIMQVTGFTSEKIEQLREQTN